MIDFDETGLYKGFVKNQKGKKFPGRNPQLLTLPEVDAFDSFSGIMYPNVVLIDADEEPHNEKLQNIIKGEGLACYMTDREGGRGAFSFTVFNPHQFTMSSHIRNYQNILHRCQSAV